MSFHSVYVLHKSMVLILESNNMIYSRNWGFLKEHLVFIVKSSESETHDVVEGFEL